MTPKIEWCNWVFDYMDTNKWMVKRIIDDYKRSFKEYDKALDELLEEK